jgi:hypothetical protein
VPTDETKLGKVATAWALTPTPLTSPVADKPVTDMLLLVTRLILPKAEVPANPLTEILASPVTEVSVPSADVA